MRAPRRALPMVGGDEAAFETRLRETLARKSLGAELRVFESSVHSVAEAARVVGAPIESFVKSVCFVGLDGALAVAVVKGEDRASSSRVASALAWQERPRLATPEEILARAGFPAGGVPPLGFDAAWLVDERVVERDAVWAGGGSARALLHIKVSEMIRASGARVARIRK